LPSVLISCVLVCHERRVKKHVSRREVEKKSSEWASR
jgi:hypothetical protein